MCLVFEQSLFVCTAGLVVGWGWWDKKTGQQGASRQNKYGSFAIWLIVLFLGSLCVAGCGLQGLHVAVDSEE